MPNATWHDLYDAALVELDPKKLPDRVEGPTLSAEERDEIDDALRTLFTLIQRSVPCDRRIIVDNG